MPARGSTEPTPAHIWESMVLECGGTRLWRTLHPPPERINLQSNVFFDRVIYAQKVHSGSNLISCMVVVVFLNVR